MYAKLPMLIATDNIIVIPFALLLNVLENLVKGFRFPFFLHFFHFTQGHQESYLDTFQECQSSNFQTMTCSPRIYLELGLNLTSLQLSVHFDLLQIQITTCQCNQHFNFRVTNQLFTHYSITWNRDLGGFLVYDSSLCLIGTHLLARVVSFAGHVHSEPQSPCSIHWCSLLGYWWFCQSIIGKSSHPVARSIVNHSHPPCHPVHLLLPFMSTQVMILWVRHFARLVACCPYPWPIMLSRNLLAALELLRSWLGSGSGSLIHL